MSTVTFRRPKDAPFSYRALLYAGPPDHGYRTLDRGAIEAAAEMLGIRQVTIQPWLGRGYANPVMGMSSHYRGKWTVSISLDLPPGGASPDYEKFEIGPNPWNYFGGFDYTLWHELGHVIDMQDWDEDRMRGCAQLANAQPFEDYKATRAERFADSIADKYAAEYPLSR